MSKPKRHVLEDSDSDDDGGLTVPEPAADIGSEFFTAKENEAIEKCNIQINDNKGRYSEEYMVEPITALGGLIERAEGDPSPRPYERYCVKKKEKEAFFDRAFYNVHGKNGKEYVDVSPPSEEAILLEIEAIRRSAKGVKTELFKKKETGGMVVFGPWWNYALKRLLELSADKSIDDKSLAEYTAVKIMASLFSTMKDGFNDVIKPGVLGKLKGKMGVDWLKNVRDARKVIKHCGRSRLLEEELSAAEAYVEGLKEDKPAASAENVVSPAQNSAVAAASAAGAPSKQAQDEAREKAIDARNQRMAQLKANLNLRRVSSAGPASPPKAASSFSVGGGELPVQRRELSRTVEPTSVGHDLKQNNVGSGHLPNLENGHGSRQPPSDLPVNGDRRQPPAQPARSDLSNAGNSSPRGFQYDASSRKNDDGWGRRRDGNPSTKPVRAKGSWNSARRTLSCNNPVDSHARPQESVQPSQGNGSDPHTHQDLGSQGGGGTAPVSSSAAAAPDINHRARDSHDDSARPAHSSAFSGPDNEFSTRGVHDDYDGRGGHDRSTREYESRGGSRHDSSRSDSYSSRRGNSTSGRFESRSDYRSPDCGRDGEIFDCQRDRDRDSHSRSSSSRGGDYARDDFMGDEQHHSSSQDRGSSRDYGSSGGYEQGSKHSRSPDREDRERFQKRFKGPPPVTSATLGSSAAGINANYANVPVTPSAPDQGRGRGRGAHVNKPAWMTQQERASNDGPTGISPISSAGPGTGAAATNTYATATVNTSVAAPSGAERTGRGRGISNQPAWMTRQEYASSSGPSEMNNVGVQQQAPTAPSTNHSALGLNPPSPVNGLLSDGGRGRGRGRGKTLPAWMTNPTNSST